ncbi:MAG: hypothetical protein JXA54_11780 [Candidatus Heimdallarchaeota archaeon]|nr:hypothetical protein [Candidatus Heimdallarchaeota archaeon]
MQYDTWVFTEGIWDHLSIVNIYINGVFDSNPGFSLKIEDLVDILMTAGEFASRAVALGAMATAFVVIGVPLLLKGIEWIGMVMAAKITGAALTALGFSIKTTLILGWFSMVIGILFVLAVIAIVITIVVMAYSRD